MNISALLSLPINSELARVDFAISDSGMIWLGVVNSELARVDLTMSD